MLEGFRKSDLKRWKKYSYLNNKEEGNTPKNNVIGAYFDFTRFTKKEKDLIINKVTKAAMYCPIPGDSTRIALNPITSQLNRRDWVEGDISFERQYFTSVPKDQIKLYKDFEVVLKQYSGCVSE